MESKNYIAIDIGASNGRIIVGKYNGSNLDLIETHRFKNNPVFLGDIYYWDFLNLFSELKNGISIASQKYDKISSLGIDTCGSDFGLLDKHGELLSNPVHYRDKRTIGISDKVFNIIPKKKLYRITGVQSLEVCTIFQLYSLVLKKSAILENSRYFLQMGDLLNYFLVGKIFCEYTNATVSQLVNLRSKKWDKAIFNKLNIPENIFPEIIEPGVNIGKIRKNIYEELGCKQFRVALPAYDTSSENAAIPISGKDSDKCWVYLNCGTWSMVGIQTNTPIVTDESYNNGFGNEGGLHGRFSFIKNMIGLWIIQKCRERWIKDLGKDILWDDIVKQTEKARDFGSFIDIDSPVFNNEIFDMPQAIGNFCKLTGQNIPETIGEVSSCFFESLVLKYLYNIEILENLISKKIELLHLVGGGSRNKLLCQWISDATGIPLISGPSETTAIGNLMTQIIADNEISNIEEGREIIRNSVKLKYYFTNEKETDKWMGKYDYFKNKALNKISGNI